ncbi:hypothetical protein [Tautonia rosea]|uniref:hypothetical protein n=1 Tax=Tautonia rosea TaxID=2728037 RepID=UPI001473C023|nr:hypothetical protein [Tautonia rosea]
MSDTERELIPPPPVIRAKLARNVREARRLRALLRLAEKAEQDRQFCERLNEQTAPHKANGRGVR